MSRARAVFSVGYRGLRVKVRLLPTLADVHRECRATTGKALRGEFVSGFFWPATTLRSAHVGTLVIPVDGDLLMIVPHEVTHAVMAALGVIHADDDERLAWPVGELTSRILRRIRDMGIAL